MAAWCGQVDVGERDKLFYSLILEHLQPGAQTKNDTGFDRITGLRKQIERCPGRMVRRQLGEGDDGVAFPMGATQGTATALGYSQSWTMSGGSTGELYLSKLEKKLLGVGSKLGAHSPLEDLC